MRDGTQSTVSSVIVRHFAHSTFHLILIHPLVIGQCHAFAAEREQSLFAWRQQTAHALKKQTTQSPCGRELIQLLNNTLQ